MGTFEGRPFGCVCQDPCSGRHRIVKMTLKDYCEYAKVTTDLEPLYLFEAEVPEGLTVVPPRFITADHFPLLDGTKYAERKWLVIGPQGSGTRFHVDPVGSSAWNLVIEGKKR